MLSIIKNTFFLFLKKIDIFTLFIIPLLIVNIYKMPSWVSIILTSFLSIITSYSIYIYILRLKDIRLLKSLKLFLKYIFADLGISSLFYLIIFIMQKLFNNISSYLSYTVIYFFGLYFLTRFSIILPMIINKESLSFKSIIQKTNEKYLVWLMAGTIIYLPFMIARVYFNQGFAYQLISAWQIPWLCCFNTMYLKKA